MNLTEEVKDLNTKTARLWWKEPLHTLFGNVNWYSHSGKKHRHSPQKLKINYHMSQQSSVQLSSVAQSCLTLWSHEPQHTRPPCPSPTHGVYTNSCPLSRWCHPTISSSVIPFSSCLQFFPASGSFQMSQLFTSGGQSIRVSASTSVPPMNTQDWSPLGWTGWIDFWVYIQRKLKQDLKEIFALPCSSQHYL